uniref:Ribonuclease H n=1 Tax=Glossina brevipalpis TaxID=37001 RepID=A0A1A9WGL9_9MUSC
MLFQKTVLHNVQITRIMSFYAVACGRAVGIYKSWKECEEQVKGFKGAKYKKFPTRAAAEKFIVGDKPTGKTVCDCQKSSRIYLEDVTTLPTNGGKEFWPSDHEIKNEEVDLTDNYLLYALAEVEGIPKPRSELKQEIDDVPKPRNELNQETDGVPKPRSELKQEIDVVPKPRSELQQEIDGVPNSRSELEQEIDSVPNTRSELQQEIDGVPKPRSGVKRKKHFFFRPAKNPKLDPIGTKRIGCYDFQINEDGYILVYTDGSCFNNGGENACAGYGVYFGDDHPLNAAEPVTGRVTNNVGEIQAAIYAVRTAKSLGIDKLCISTDSQFLINAVVHWIKGWKTKNWRLHNGDRVKNEVDFKVLDNLLEDKTIDVNWNHVKAHRGIKGNEMADKLAKTGAEIYKRTFLGEK